MEYFLGDIVLFSFNFTPYGWIRCDGTILNILQNQALYALLANTYGGDGQTTFAVPDLTGSEPDPNLRYCICTNGLWPPRS